MSSAAGLLQALAVSVAAERVLHGRTRELRAAADAALGAAREEFGTKSLELRVFGEKVGTLSQSLSRPEVYVEDEEAYQGWLCDRAAGGDQRVTAFYEAPLVEKCALPRANGDGTYAVFDALSGEAVPGLVYRRGGEPKGTRVTGCSPDDVMGCLAREGMGLADALGLLGGGAS